MSIYQNCFDLIHQYIYGGVTLTADMSLVCTALATAACVFVFAVPFMVVGKAIKIITGGFR